MRMSRLLQREHFSRRSTPAICFDHPRRWQSNVTSSGFSTAVWRHALQSTRSA